MPDLGKVQQKDHYVYVHYDWDSPTDQALYVGCTSNPKRAHLKTGRPWVGKDSTHIEVSPPMPYEAAAWAENVLIRALGPTHNRRQGRLIEYDPLVRDVATRASVTHTQAREFCEDHRDLSPDEFDRAVEEFRDHMTRQKDERSKFLALNADEREAHIEEGMVRAMAALDKFFSPIFSDA